MIFNLIIHRLQMTVSFYVGILLIFHLWCILFAGLSLSFESPVALFFTPVTNLLLCGWIASTTGNFTRSIEGQSGILSRNRCYGLRPLMTALVSNVAWFVINHVKFGRLIQTVTWPLASKVQQVLSSCQNDLNRDNYWLNFKL